MSSYVYIDIPQTLRALKIVHFNIIDNIIRSKILKIIKEMAVQKIYNVRR